MLALSDLSVLVRWAPRHVGRRIWATQALGQPDGRINGGLLVIGAYWLHNSTEAALRGRAELESREQSLVDGFFAGHVALLPKRFNVEALFWESSHAVWREHQRQTRGEGAVPPDAIGAAMASPPLATAAAAAAVDASANVNDSANANASGAHANALHANADSANANASGAHANALHADAAHTDAAAPVVLLHYVGRDKPWTRYEHSSQQRPQAARPQTAAELCQRLRQGGATACTRYLAAQGIWWSTLARSRCLLVGSAAAHRAQGFVVDAFGPRVMRMHAASLPALDVGSATGTRCPDAPACLAAARMLYPSCARVASGVLSLGREVDLSPSTRTLLDGVYQEKAGVFGGPAGQPLTGPTPRAAGIP